PNHGGAMSPAQRQTVTRRRFLTALSAMTAAAGGFFLARGASPLEALAARADADAAPPSVQRQGEKTMLNQINASRAMSTTGADTSIRPFRIDVPQAALDTMRARIVSTQWPEKETVADLSQGVPLATMQQLARHWATEYDWRKVEAKLNALPQFMTEI